MILICAAGLRGLLAACSGCPVRRRLPRTCAPGRGKGSGDALLLVDANERMLYRAMRSG